MIQVNQLNPQYITNENGDKQAVVLSIQQFNELIEDLEDLAAIAERIDEPIISHEQLKNDLKKDGNL